LIKIIIIIIVVVVVVVVLVTIIICLISFSPKDEKKKEKNHLCSEKFWIRRRIKRIKLNLILSRTELYATTVHGFQI